MMKGRFRAYDSRVFLCVKSDCWRWWYPQKAYYRVGMRMRDESRKGKRGNRKKNQPDYKPGSVSATEVEMSVIYPHLPLPTGSIVLPSNAESQRSPWSNLLALHRTSNPQCVGIHELSAPDVHSPYVTTRLVGSYSTFSPLPKVCLMRIVKMHEACRTMASGLGGCFLLH